MSLSVIFKLCHDLLPLAHLWIMARSGKQAGVVTSHKVRYHKGCMSLLQAYAGVRLSKHLYSVKYTGYADVKLTISILCLRSDHRLVPVCSIALLFR